ncbi:MAG TPA: magnesium transporter [Guyparkeria sp.]|nr:magnesium transporter [Guyparkeria sp.]
MVQSEKVQRLTELLGRFERAEIGADALRGEFATIRDQDIARAISRLEPDGRRRVLEVLPVDRRAAVFTFFVPREQFELIERLDEAVSRELLEGLPPDDLTALLEDLDREESGKVVRRLSPERVQQALRLLGYPPESAGRLMTPDFIALRPEWLLSQVLDYVRQHAGRSETINVLYVTDEAGRLLGWVRLRNLVLGDPAATVESLMDADPVQVDVSVDREEVARLIQHYDLMALPVVDDAGVLMGIVTIDDVMDVIEEEATEDIHKFGALGVKHVSMRGASVFDLFKKRIGWLLLLVFLSLFSAGAVSSFEDVLGEVMVLIFFLPLIIDSGGNAGSQGATMMVRALATGDVSPDDWVRLWVKELAVASALGLAMGVAAWGVGLLYGGTMLANVIFLSMIAVVIFGSMVGMLLPFLLTRFRLDPATASAPLITTVADLGGIIIYLGIASLWLGGMPAS